jgi:hypothetical protein
MTFDRRAAPFTADQVEDLHRAIFLQPTKRTYSFSTLEELHAFQAAVTSFNVKYDGLARDFTISRRRPVTALSKHKRLEAGATRVQVVSHDNDKVVQLLAFFDDSFPYAEAIGFVLKGMDVFERYDGKHSGGKGKVGVRLVDAKFALPKLEKAKGGQRPEDIERPFVCLDMPEFPGENDDIWIGFDDEDGKATVLLFDWANECRTGPFSCCIAGAGYEHASWASGKEIGRSFRARRYGKRWTLVNVLYTTSSTLWLRSNMMGGDGVIHATIPNQLSNRFSKHCLIICLSNYVVTGLSILSRVAFRPVQDSAFIRSLERITGCYKLSFDAYPHHEDR